MGCKAVIDTNGSLKTALFRALLKQKYREERKKETNKQKWIFLLCVLTEISDHNS